MAAGIVFKKWTVSGSPTSLTSILGYSYAREFSRITIKNAQGAANVLLVGGADVDTNAGLELAANQGYVFERGDDGGRMISSDDVYLVGTAAAGNVAFIACVL